MRNLFFVLIGVMVFSAAAAVVTGLPHAQSWGPDGVEPPASATVAEQAPTR
jgi:hypothetical protein